MNGIQLLQIACSQLKFLLPLEDFTPGESHLFDRFLQVEQFVCFFKCLLDKCDILYVARVQVEIWIVPH